MNIASAEAELRAEITAEIERIEKVNAKLLIVTKMPIEEDSDQQDVDEAYMDLADNDGLITQLREQLDDL